MIATTEHKGPSDITHDLKIKCQINEIQDEIGSEYFMEYMEEVACNGEHIPITYGVKLMIGVNSDNINNISIIAE